MIRNILKKVAQCLADEHIAYGLGGSGVLVAYDIQEEMNDIDIVVSLEDIQKAKEVLDTIAIFKNSGKN